MVDLTFVSTNSGKQREVRALLAPYGVRVLSRRRALPEPQASDLESVVRAKLAAVADVPGYVLVEDSGLFIPSLEGFPGVYSAHFLDIWGFDPIFELLRRRDRRAYFRTVAGLRRGSREWLFSGEVHGRIARRATGKHGFGFDPIFIASGGRRTFAELTSSDKNRISHRSAAVRKVGDFLSPGARRVGPAPSG